jgi:hypothetical protein
MIKVEFYNEAKPEVPLGFLECNAEDVVKNGKGSRLLHGIRTTSDIITTAHTSKVFFESDIIIGSLHVLLVPGQVRRPIPFPEPLSGEMREEKALRRLLELPLPSYILSHPIPSGWEIRRDKQKDSKEYGFYFLQPGTRQPTAILWHDPVNVIDENTNPTEDEVRRLQPIRYHFPEAFYVDEECENAVETILLVSDKKWLVKRIPLE